MMLDLELLDGDFGILAVNTVSGIKEIFQGDQAVLENDDIGGIIAVTVAALEEGIIISSIHLPVHILFRGIHILAGDDDFFRIGEKLRTGRIHLQEYRKFHKHQGQDQDEAKQTTKQ